MDELKNLTAHCEAFNIKPADYDIKSYDMSVLTMPVMLLAGALDVATLLYWATDFYEKLPQKGENQHFIVWQNKVHSVLFADSCVSELVASFLKNQSLLIATFYKKAFPSLLSYTRFLEMMPNMLYSI